MTRIETARPGVTRGFAVLGPQPGPQHAGAAFHVPDDISAPASGTAASLAPASAVALTALLATEVLDRDDVHDRAARTQGRAILHQLTALQAALLDPGRHAEALDQLAALITTLPHAAEPRLAALLSSIVLRARVELARHGR
jgi:hypothetical protein